MDNQYFTVAEATVLQRATSYQELSEVALRQLRRIQKSSVTLAGITCGPISNGGLGSIEANIVHFERVVKHLTAQKNGVFFSQIPFEESLWRVQTLMAQTDKTVHPKGAGNPLLEGFYRPIFTSGLIGAAYFIKGWESSDGACWERELCLQEKILVVDLDESMNPLQVSVRS